MPKDTDKSLALTTLPPNNAVLDAIREFGNISVGEVTADDIVAVFTNDTQSQLAAAYTQLQEAVASVDKEIAKRLDTLNSDIQLSANTTATDLIEGFLGGLTTFPGLDLSKPSRPDEKQAWEAYMHPIKNKLAPLPKQYRNLGAFCQVEVSALCAVDTETLNEQIGTKKKEPMGIRISVHYGWRMEHQGYGEKTLKLSFTQNISAPWELDIAPWRDDRKAIAALVDHRAEMRTQLSELNRALGQLPRMEKDLRASLSRARIESAGEKGKHILKFLSEAQQRSARFQLKDLMAKSEGLLKGPLK